MSRIVIVILDGGLVLTVAWHNPMLHFTSHICSHLKLAFRVWGQLRLATDLTLLLPLTIPECGPSKEGPEPSLAMTVRRQFLLLLLRKLSLYQRSGTSPTSFRCHMRYTNKQKLHGLSPRANYTDRATATCRRSDCQLLRIKGATGSAWRIPTAVFSVF
jgi:hypothetical protein